ncbi:MAG: hypothetical protein JSW28_05305 [Thermoplasmata archaeon]|nr:MAG: hypothetical protein JSW28_05305 [Thermoplasmata archaeon]
MKRAFLFAMFVIIMLTLFTANSVSAAWGEDWDKRFSIATQPRNIIGRPDYNVTSLGISTNYDGRIYIIINSTFELRNGTDVTVYGLDIDNSSEGYEVHYGIWDRMPIFISTVCGYAYDSDWTVSFDLGLSMQRFNMIAIFAIDGTGGSWPGPEIDAVQTHYP